MELFHGRRDVYAAQWLKEGKPNYSPVCGNRWNPALCKRPHIKCADCACTSYLPFDEKVAAAHLNGQKVIGIYTILPGDLCHFLAIDLDEGNWRDDVTAIRTVCRERAIPCTVEISRSGNGAHVWFFFEEAENAASARCFGIGILDAAMRSRAAMSFKSYDRMFPNQDTMPKGGIGNLIALPLQREAARTTGGSLFVDESFKPYPDQWAYLSEVVRLRHEEIIAFGEKAEGTQKSVPDGEAVKPWQREVQPASEDFGDFVSITLADRMYISADGLSEKAKAALKRIAAFKNPAFYKQQAMRMPVRDTPRTICCAEISDEYICLPRGCLQSVTELVESAGRKTGITDERQRGRAIQAEFCGTLRDEQIPAVQALASQDNGILSAATAFGKTVVAAALIAAKKVNTLIIVNRTQLLDQWQERLTQFLNIQEELPEQPKKRGRARHREVIGRFGAGKNTRSGIVDIAVMQSLGKADEIRDWIGEYGMVIVDECHHVPAFTFEAVMKAVPARYTFGLTATPKRADGHQPILNMYLGPIRYQADALAQSVLHPFTHVMVPRFTGAAYTTEEGRTLSIVNLYEQIMRDELRNAMIVEDVLTCVREKRNCLVLSERTEHVHMLAEQIGVSSVHVFTLTGSARPAEKQLLLTEVRNAPPDEPLVICATGKYIGEGFDESRLDTLFLTMPIAWKGTLAQYIGRLHRLHEGKQEVRVYDYIDNNTEMLSRMYAKRLKGYAAIGYQAAALSDDGNTPDVIYHSDNYLETLTADINRAERTVLIASPFVADSVIRQLAPSLQEAIKRRVAVTILCNPPENFNENAQASMLTAIDRLKELSAEVRISADRKYRFAILDEATVWYGGINLLGGHAEESALRIVSRKIAKAVQPTDTTRIASDEAVARTAARDDR